MPGIFEHKTAEDQVRIWVAGCATGEEAYTIAMLCAERTFGIIDAPKVQIFATDIDESAVAAAREGFYTLNDAADISAERLSRFFMREGEGYRIRREIRETILFAQHNFLKDPPFSRIDLVSCRNVLIYLNRAAQERVMETFHFALKPGGFMLLGTSESVDIASDLFKPFSREQHIYQSRITANLRTIIVPETVPQLRTIRPAAHPAETRPSQSRMHYSDLHLQLVEQYAPPSLVVNADFDVVHVSPRAGHYLKLGAGEPTQAVLTLVRNELRAELRNGLYQAMQKGTPVSSAGLRVRTEQGTEDIQIHVRPVMGKGEDTRGYLLVVFEPAIGDEVHADIIAHTTGESAAHQLEEELLRLHAQLRTSNEQHEFQAEELKAGNEELQAMNEELRSATEELETSKEELQSINEELSTVNQELKVKVEEATMVSNNLQNLINSTDIGTIFLDRSLRVVLFTPAVRSVFNLIAADYARPLSDITGRLRDDSLLEDAALVLERLQAIEREMPTTDGRSFLIRLSPYRTEDDRIQGVVISFVDITERKKAESALRAAEEWRRLILESAEDYAIFTTDLERRVNSWNIGAQNVFGYRDEEIIGKSGDMLFTAEDREAGRPASEAGRALKEGRAENERWHLRKDGSPFWGSGLTHPLRDEAGKPIGFVKIMRDLSAQKQVELSRYFLAAAVESSNDSVVTVGPDNIITSWNKAAETMFGYPAAEAIGHSLTMLTLPEDLKEALRNTDKVMHNKTVLNYDTIRIHKDGHELDMEIVLSPVKNDAGEIVGVSTVARDITERKRAEEAVAADLKATTLLRELGARLTTEIDIRNLYEEILSAAITLSNAQAGTVQILDHEAQELVTLASQGFDQRVMEHFHRLDATSGTSCGIAMARNKRTLIRYDVPESEDLTGDLRMHVEAGYLSGQSTPLVTRSGRPIGMLSTHWHLHYQPNGQELRYLDLLARQAADLIERLRFEQALRESEEKLAIELADTQQLQRASSAMVEEDDVAQLYEQILEAARAIMRSDFASIQMLIPERNELLLLSHIGFAPESAEHWKWVNTSGTTSCGLAMSGNERVIVPDAELWNLLAGTEDLAHYRLSGIRAMQSTRLVSRTGQLVGVISTHWREPHHPSDRELAVFDVLAREVADLIERRTAEEALRESHARITEILESISDVFYMLDKDYVYTYVNRKAEEAWGRTRDEVLGKTLWEAFPQIKGSESERKHQKAMASREPVHYEAVSPILNRWLSVGIYPASDGGVSVYFSDIEDRKNAEEALRTSERRARTLTDAIPHIIWTNQPDGTANYFNRRWYDYSGLSFEESAGLGWQAIVHPDDAPPSNERWQRALDRGEVFDTEYRLRRHNGEYRWFIGRNVPLRDDAGSIISWFGSATDIEDLKQAQELLAGSEERLRVTTESAIDYAIISMDTERLVQGWSRGSERIFGYNEEEMTGQPADIIFTPEDRAAGAPQMEVETARDEGMAPDERWHMRKDGARFYMSGVMRPIYNNGIISGYVKVARDMTKQKEAEEALRISEERYRAALQSAEMAAWDWDVAADRMVWNDQHYFILGLKPNGSNKDVAYFTSFVHPEDIALVTAQLQAAAETGIYGAEYRIIRADNKEIRWMSGYGRAVSRDEAGRATRMVGVMYDITARKRVEEQKEEFIGIASHELKTPLTSIKAYSEILHEMFATSGDEQSAKLMDKMEGQINRLTNLIRTLLDVTRIREGKLELQKHPFELDALVRELVQDMQLTTPIKLRIDSLPQVTVHADREGIAQVIVNLLSNAIKYRRGAEHVDLYIRAGQDEAVVCVRDYGIGMSKEVSGQVFERFYRAGDGGADTYPGLGLGLYISAEIVRLHGGRIWVDSEVDKGSLFCFSLPLQHDVLKPLL